MNKLLLSLVLSCAVLLPAKSWAAFPDYATVVDTFPGATSIDDNWTTMSGTDPMIHDSGIVKPNSNTLCFEFRKGGLNLAPLTGIRKEVYYTNVAANQFILLALFLDAGIDGATRDGYQFYHAAGTANLVRVNDGSDTSLGTASFTPANGYKYGLVKDDTTGEVTAYVNTGGGWSALITATDNTLTGTMRAAMAAAENTATFDDFAQGEGASIGGGAATPHNMTLMGVGK